jgi:hypothetical protein
MMRTGPRGDASKGGTGGAGASRGGTGGGVKGGAFFFFFFFFFFVDTQLVVGVPPFLGGGWSGVATGYLHSCQLIAIDSVKQCEAEIK